MELGLSDKDAVLSVGILCVIYAIGIVIALVRRL